MSRRGSEMKSVAEKMDDAASATDELDEILQRIAEGVSQSARPRAKAAPVSAPRTVWGEGGQD